MHAQCITHLVLFAEELSKPLTLTLPVNVQVSLH